MIDIAIYGAGGLGREVACMLNVINDCIELPDERYNLVGFFEDGMPAGAQVSHFGKTLGGLEAVNAWPTPLNVAIAIGSPRHLARLSQAITNPNISFLNVIHPDFSIADPVTCTLGTGNIIVGACAITTNVHIGNFNILNGSVVIGHDTEVGNWNVIMPDVRISGSVTIGDRNLLGVKSLVIQGLKIGNDTKIGAGAVLMTKPKDGGVYLGNPAKLFKY